VDLARLDPTEDLRALDLDSMDFLNVVVGVSERLHVEIPARLPALLTLDDFTAYPSPPLPERADMPGRG
jgi:acyl carrier protein